MQLQLPIFPESTKLLNASVGVYKKEGLVYYLHNGSPIYCHQADRLDSYRFIIGTLVVNGLCSTSEVVQALGVKQRNVQRYAKAVRTNGEGWFFNKPDHRGQCHRLTADKQAEAQSLLDQGLSQLRVAKSVGVSESCIRYHLRKGSLKKKSVIDSCPASSPTVSDLTCPSERNALDLSVSDIFGVGASRIQLRAEAASVQHDQTPIFFEPFQGLDNGGVLLLLPFLLAVGLQSYKSHYQGLGAVYYDLDFTILLLSFLYLCRIKNPEQLKHINSSDFGKLLGVDRIPESKCLRKKVNQISSQNQAEQWGQSLAANWVIEDDTFIFYVDGHVQVYHGNKANLGKKHVSRQKLCLPGVNQFWVNNHEGLPYFYVNAQVNEKLQEMLKTQVIPELKENVAQKPDPMRLGENPDMPIFTIVFDREAYSPCFFGQLWEQDRVAVITYRKNVKEDWQESLFREEVIDVEGVEVKMKIAEQEVELDGTKMREIRKLTSSGHQTSILTTNRILCTIALAVYMFSRWSQENFFRYMRQEYDLDRIYQYAVKELDEDIQVVNPKHSKMTQEIKRVREKIARRKAHVYSLEETISAKELGETNKYQTKLVQLVNEIEVFEEEEKTLVEQRKQIDYKIKVKDMPQGTRYNKLDNESKHFQSIIKMICYRAETNLCRLISLDFKSKQKQMRAFVKSIIKRKIDLIPDYKAKTLRVKIYNMATPRENEELKKLCELLSQTQTKFPGTDLILVYQMATN